MKLYHFIESYWNTQLPTGILTSVPTVSKREAAEGILVQSDILWAFTNSSSLELLPAQESMI